ncbi:MAG: hypothetical protein L0287_33910, partial [Anaerolineae bacterium]|nr:hypothetical protein [Anaerolineae bacterium]
MRQYKNLGIYSLIFLFIALCITATVLLWPRLAWRLDNLRVAVRRYFNPPEQVVFMPQEQIEVIVQGTLTALAAPTSTPLPEQTATPLPSPIPSLTFTPVPQNAALSGIRHEYQKFNNCAPANLSMVLSYWGWQGDQFATRAYLRPSHEIDDKNVNPFEIVNFVESSTEYDALWRVGGDLNLIKRLVAAGFPVLIEKGLHPSHDAWLGH